MSRPLLGKPPYRLPTQFTAEQQAIIDSNAPIIFGQALAGTGKSTTAIGFVAKRPDKRALVLCFNNANAKEAKEKYPSVCPHAKVSTVHALAYERLDPELKPRIASLFLL